MVKIVASCYQEDFKMMEEYLYQYLLLKLLMCQFTESSHVSVCISCKEDDFNPQDTL
jgi:hypothetical protein